MKKNYLLALALVAGMFSQSWAQSQRSCATMHHLEQQKIDDPGLESRMQQIETQTQQIISQQSAHRTTAVLTIPVVVHVVYKTAVQNISDAQIMSQIAVLNEDYHKLNIDVANVPSVFASSVADCQIQFCMAQRDPSGNATTGIVRKLTTATSFSDNDNVKRTANNGDDAWNSSQYLNIWVCNLSNDLLGYAQFPGGAAATDGVVILYSAFGRTGTVNAPYDKGRSATHEIGHWLNLRHIWGDANCGDDLVADTPQQQTSNFGCPTFPSVTCSNGPNGDMFMNYMDYTDDACMFMFSNGQAARISASISASRSALATSLGCTPPGTTTCNVPASLASSSITASSATISWGAVSGATSYNVQYRVVGSSTWTSTTSTTTSKALSALSASTNYEFQVSTVCSAGSSAFSASANFTTSAVATCNVPASLSSSSITASNATISWGAVANATSYNVQYRVVGAASWTSTTSATTSKALSSLAASTNYEFQVSTVCSAGSSAFSSSATFTTSAVAACNIPGSLAAGSITSSGATLSWGAVSGATSYNVQYRIVGAASWTSASTASTSLALSTLAASTNYEFQVSTVCSSGSSAFSSSATFTTSATSTTCAVPSGLTATGITASTATLNWGAVSGAGSYHLQYRVNGTSTWTTLTVTTNTRALSGLTAATLYQYRVQTVCSNLSAYSTVATFTTSAASGCSDVYEPNNAQTTAKTITMNADVYGLIATNGDNDFFKFTTVAGSTNLKVTLNQLAADYDLKLINATSGATITTSQNGGTTAETITRNTTTAASYIVKVYGYSGAFNASSCYHLYVTTSGSSLRDAAPEVTSVNKIKGLEELSIYPNPADDKLSMNFFSTENSDIQLTVVDILGKNVMTNAFAAQEGFNQSSLDLGSLSNGIYFLRIQQNDQLVVKKFIVKH